MNIKKTTLEKHMGIVSSIRINHSAYAAVLDALEAAMHSAGKTSGPTLLHIAGEYRTGKSCVLREFMRQHPEHRGGEGVRQAIVYATVPHDGSVKGLLAGLLRAFGDPSWMRGTTLDQTARLTSFLHGTGCRMIILDEFQHLSDKGQKKRLDNTTDWLKNLMHEAPWALVAAGLPASSAVLNCNEQLGAGRCDATLTMPLFYWKDERSRVEFRGVLRAFVENMDPFELPDLGGGELAFRTYLAIGGRVGLLAKLMDRVVHNAIRAQTTKVRLEDIAKAFQQAIWFAPDFPLEGGPFLCKLMGDQDNLIDVCSGLANQDSAYWEAGGNVVLQGVDPGKHRNVLKPQRSRARKAESARSELRRAL